ncbi:S-adenosylmethionine:tRNA ribosyltransferase-isomerase [Verrucomicrobium sp. GAS474]|uniref:tRNA preQ1(34) S-adenosylmethionine ribosyltransferase-isomerase QueA n=1 Tax=Verrucomicrobium sp. GAS474 TaxID=1882831 RepID=UPI00087A74F2|nr:tRNA preQ1(34) S-adenosylmethionine ribosyltransferase-isomerase QueA [Verrucomicrobium sp. GAS474]SDT87945.1 S-adenosylmethionine:tRNA ribosyltransferase-isomerase [Verrucomicrobium sp. GAS474]
MTTPSRTDLLTDDFSFDLPTERIAAWPTPDRAASRLMVLDRAARTITHAQFSDLPTFLRPDDLLVLNNSRVMPASLDSADGALSILLLKETSPRHWMALVKPAKRAMPGMRHTFRSRDGKRTIEAEVLKTLESGERVFRFFDDLPLDEYGDMPIPPYILKRRKALEAEASAIPSIDDRVRYQTVYADAAQAGSVAAPTAGLHFTPEMLAKFDHAFVTLHVGLGTFRPVKVEKLADHVMHREEFEIPAGLAEKVKREDGTKRRIVAVGTTSARVLESVESLRPRRGETEIFLYPPYRFKHVGALLTNFHLPKSTLLMLVSAFAGREFILEAYREAVAKEYRFFSYGDAMLIL